MMAQECSREDQYSHYYFEKELIYYKLADL
jgi:hypothetical protein